MLNHVFFLGNSILIASVASSLAGYPDMRVTRLDPSGLAMGMETCALEKRPVIVFDTSLESPAQLFGILVKMSAWVLIGLDPNTQNTLIVSGQFSSLGGVNELAGIIQQSRL